MHSVFLSLFLSSYYVQSPYVQVHSIENIFLVENLDWSHISDRTVYWLWTLILMVGCFLFTLESAR